MYILINPAIVFRPYKVPCGPRRISIFSISIKSKSNELLSRYGTLSTFNPTAGELIREPIPRIYIDEISLEP